MSLTIVLRDRFGKRKLDILCKDHKNKKTDGNFAVTLHVTEDFKVTVLEIFIRKRNEV